MLVPDGSDGVPVAGGMEPEGADGIVGETEPECADDGGVAAKSVDGFECAGAVGGVNLFQSPKLKVPVPAFPPGKTSWMGYAGPEAATQIVPPWVDVIEMADWPLMVPVDPWWIVPIPWVMLVAIPGMDSSAPWEVSESGRETQVLDMALACRCPSL